MSELAGKTALVTGAAKRIGRAVAVELARAGVNIIVHYRSSQAEAEVLVRELGDMGVEAWSIRADFAVSDEVDSLMQRARDLAGPIHILINNASSFPKVTLDSLTLDALLESVTVEAWTPFALGRSFAKYPEAERIINFLDTRIKAEYDWTHAGYFAGKYLLGMFSSMMAVQFAPKVSVNAVAPGLILPPEGKDLSYLESLKDDLPLKRIGRPEYVAEAVLYLVKSDFLTGQVIYVDGGRHLHEVTGG